MGMFRDITTSISSFFRTINKLFLTAEVAADGLHQRTQIATDKWLSEALEEVGVKGDAATKTYFEQVHARAEHRAKVAIPVKPAQGTEASNG